VNEHSQQLQAFRPLLGTWINTHERAQWLAGFTLAETDRGLTLALLPVSSEEHWEIALCDSFAIKPGESSFYARFQSADSSAELAAFTNKGLFVVAAYLEYPQAPERTER
jgi:hypothetical protein